MRKRPVFLFLTLTFALTWTLEAFLIAGGLVFDGVIGTHNMLYLVLAMWIPGLCAAGVHCGLERRPLRDLGFRFGSWKAYLSTMLLIPLLYGVIYALTWLSGLGHPDWQLERLLSLQRMAPGQEMPVSMLFLSVLPASIVLGPFGNFLAALGEEIGWRGFLLPRLMPMGKLNAYALLGLVWGLWHAPLVWVGFNYPGYPFVGIVMMALGCTAFGTLFNEFTLKYRSVLLAAWMHAALNAQGYGIWHYLFPDVNPVLGGDTGLTGLIVWGGAALIAMRTLKAGAQGPVL